MRADQHQGAQSLEEGLPDLPEWQSRPTFKDGTSLVAELVVEVTEHDLPGWPGRGGRDSGTALSTVCFIVRTLSFTPIAAVAHVHSNC